MTTPILRIRLEAEEDVVAARRKARAIAAGFGFSTLDQTRIASAVSEIARNAFEALDGCASINSIPSAFGRPARLLSHWVILFGPWQNDGPASATAW